MSERDATTFGQWLRRRRRDLGLTQAELARKVGCATVTVQKIEADERRPSRDMASWLAEAFEIGVSERQRFLRLARAGRTLTTRDQVALDRRPTNLPLVLPQLIGRERDLQMARKRLLQGERTRRLRLRFGFLSEPGRDKMAGSTFGPAAAAARRRGTAAGWQGAGRLR